MMFVLIIVVICLVVFFTGFCTGFFGYIVRQHYQDWRGSRVEDDFIVIHDGDVRQGQTILSVYMMEICESIMRWKRGDRVRRVV